MNAGNHQEQKRLHAQWINILILMLLSAELNADCIETLEEWKHSSLGGLECRLSYLLNVSELDGTTVKDESNIEKITPTTFAECELRARGFLDDRRSYFIANGATLCHEINNYFDTSCRLIAEKTPVFCEEDGNTLFRYADYYSCTFDGLAGCDVDSGKPFRAYGQARTFFVDPTQNLRLVNISFYVGKPLMCPMILTKVDSVDKNKPGYSSTRPGLIQQYPPSDPAKAAEVAALTRKLEEGVSLYDLLSDAMKSAFTCMQGKFAAAGVPLSTADITGTVRTRAYQMHFVEIAEADAFLKAKITEDSKYSLRCRDLNQAVYTEQFGTPRKYNQGHGKITTPAETKSNHEDGNAIDIKRKTAEKLEQRLKTTSTPNVNDYLADCAGQGMQIQWGQYFKDSRGRSNPDPVHYQLVPKP